MKTYTILYRLTKESFTECIDTLTFDDMIDRYNDLIKAISFISIRDDKNKLIGYIDFEKEWLNLWLIIFQMEFPLLDT